MSLGSCLIGMEASLLGHEDSKMTIQTDSALLSNIQKSQEPVGLGRALFSKHELCLGAGQSS